MAWSNTSQRTQMAVEKSHSLSFSVRIEDRLHKNIIQEEDLAWFTVRPANFDLGFDDDDIVMGDAETSLQGDGVKVDGVLPTTWPTDPAELEKVMFRFEVDAEMLNLDPELDWWYDITYVRLGYSMSVAAGEFIIAPNVTNRGAGYSYTDVGDVFQLVSTIEPTSMNLLTVSATLPMPSEGPPGNGSYVTSYELAHTINGQVTIPVESLVLIGTQTPQVGDVVFSSHVNSKGELGTLISIQYDVTPPTCKVQTMQLYAKDGLNALLDQTFRFTGSGPFYGFDTNPPHPTNTWVIPKTSVPLPTNYGIQYHIGDFVMSHAGLSSTATAMQLIISVVEEVQTNGLRIRPIMVFPLYLNAGEINEALKDYVPKVTAVNSKQLQSDITLNEDDIPAGVNNAKYANAEKSKLAGLPTGPDLTTQLNGKAASVHSHPISQVTNLQTELDKKPNSNEIDTITVLTLAAYNALVTKDARTQYLIVG